MFMTVEKVGPTDWGDVETLSKAIEPFKGKVVDLSNQRRARGEMTWEESCDLIVSSGRIWNIQVDRPSKRRLKLALKKAGFKIIN